MCMCIVCVLYASVCVFFRNDSNVLRMNGASSVYPFIDVESVVFLQ